MDKQIFKDRLLESENLTDELADSQAKWLIDWGMNRLDFVLDGVENPDTAGERTSALMAVMRSVNRIVGQYPEKTMDDLLESLAELDHLYREAFFFNSAPSQNVSPGEYHTAAKHLSGLSTQAALEYLTGGNLSGSTGVPTAIQ